MVLGGVLGMEVAVFISLPKLCRLNLKCDKSVTSSLQLSEPLYDTIGFKLSNPQLGHLYILKKDGDT